MKNVGKHALLYCLVVCILITALVGVSYSKYRTTLELGSFSLSVVVSDAPPSASLVGIALTQMPDTTVYAVGDKFDTTGMVITGEYDDGSDKVITGYTLSNHKNIKLNQSVVDLSYGGYELEIPIQVGYRVTYDANGGLFGTEEQNDIIVMSGQQTITRISKTDNVSDDGSTYDEVGYGDEQERNDVITIPGASSLKVTITYATESVDYDWIAVYDGSVTPTVDNYDESVSGPLGNDEIMTETFVIEGDTVQIFLVSDESTCEYYGYYAVVEATVSGSEIIDGEVLIPERGGYAFDRWYFNQNATGSEFDETYIVDENMTVYASWFEIYPVEMTIVTSPDIVIYSPGDEFDSTGMVIEVTYSDGSVKTVSDYEILDGDSLLDDQTSVVISYTDIYSDVTLEVEQPISIVFPQAVYCENGTLRFVNTTKLDVGSTYNGSVVVDVYTGFTVDEYTSTDDVPWHEHCDEITKVIFESKIVPNSTAYWFADMVNLTKIDVVNATACSVLDVVNLDMSNVQSAESMFNGCSSLPEIDLRKQDLSSLENVTDMFAGCTSITRALADNETDRVFLNENSGKPDDWQFYLVPDDYDSDEEFDRLVSEYALKYINEYRVAEGVPELEMLPGLTLVAEYRADQLITKFEHDAADKREAHNYCKYGEYVDASHLGYIPYYASGATEAISARGAVINGTLEEQADAMGYSIATGLHNSSGHWSYVGSAEYSYVGIGFECIIEDDIMYGKSCVMVNDVDYG